MNARRGKAGQAVLIVDDDPVCRLFCAHTLAARRYRTHTASNGARAFDLGLRFLPAVVVTDMHLPDMSGYDVLLGIRSLWPNTSALPRFIAMSGDESVRSHPVVQGGQFDDLLLKPFTPEALLARVDTGGNHPCPASQPGLTSDACHVPPVTKQSGRIAIPPLQNAFRAQLHKLISDFDQSIALLDWKRAGNQLHRLTGAAGLAGFSSFARQGRRLLQQLTDPPDIALFAQAYLDFLRRARKLLEE